MEENRFAQISALAEAATNEPAFVPNPSASTQRARSAAADDDWPAFASEGEEEAYWKGMAQGIRSAGREPGHPHMPADFDLDLTRNGNAAGLVSPKLLEAVPPEDTILPARAPARQDGFTPEKRRIFLTTLAACGVAADACRAARISRVTAYNLRNSAEGRAFALAWDAALLIARSRLSDEVFSRAMCGVIDRVYRDGELVAERHRYDNRLTMAVLTRLDRQAEGQGEGAPTARVIAQEWDQFLDIVDEGGDGAQAFLEARAAPPREVAARSAGGGSPVYHAASHRGPSPRSGDEDVESTASMLARLTAYRKFQAGLPHEIGVSDLDPADMESWTEEQWARAEFSGLLDTLEPSAWPEAARAAGGDEADGMCKVRKAWLDRHQPRVDAHADEDEDYEDCDGDGDEDVEDDLAGCGVWETSENIWMTSFPPPAGFEGFEEGEPGEEDYRRELTDAEYAAMGLDEETLEAEYAERLAAQCAARDRYFGFEPSPEPDGSKPE